MLEKLKEFIKQENLFTSEDAILLGVSGGIDSICMLNLFSKAGFNFSVAHINFQLRGEESDQDEQFVQNLANNYGCKFYSKRFDTQKYADERNISIQMAAREIRYDWFEELCNNYEFNYIAVAHNMNDNAETFIINLVRGTGLKGISGIKPKTKKIIRPLLFAQREEIEKYVIENNLMHREDSSNSSTKYLRNKIRHEILPLLQELNPNIINTIYENSSRFNHAEIIYQNNIAQIKKELLQNKPPNYFININKLLSNKELTKTILFEILSDFDFTNKIINDIFHSLTGPSGKKFYSNTHRILKDRENLIISPIEKNKIHDIYIEEDVNSIENPVKLNIQIIDKTEKFEIIKNKNIAYFDYDKIDFPLILRKWHTGDYFQPFGMQGLKKLSDYFIDNKFSIAEKENTWIMTTSEKIMWVIGHRTDDRFKIGLYTKKIVKIEFLANMF